MNGDVLFSMVSCMAWREVDSYPSLAGPCVYLSILLFSQPLLYNDYSRHLRRGFAGNRTTSTGLKGGRIEMYIIPTGDLHLPLAKLPCLRFEGQQIRRVGTQQCMH